MAQTGYTPIIVYNSGTASNVPLAANLASGELALNYADGKLYYKNGSGAVTLLASSATVAPVTTFSAGTTGLTPNTATSGAITLAGTLVVGNGGTGLTTLTAGYIPYGNGTSAFSNSSNLQTNGTGLGIGTAASSSFMLNILAPASTEYASFNGTTAGYCYAEWKYSGTTYGTIGNGTATVTGGANTDYGLGATTNLLFATGGTTERLRITSAGLVCINGTSGTALTTIASSATYPALKVPNIVETANTVAGAPSATTNFYLTSGAVQYYTTNAANNWTINFAFSAGTTLNTALAVGDSVSCTLLTTQGTTAYYNSAVQIDGTSVTPKWQGGTAPTSGNASSIDSYTYVIYKTAASTYTVLASQTKFA